MSVRVLSRRSELLSAARVPHLTNEERAQVAALLARLKQECEEDVRRVILYGSKARGDADNESDVDLLIVTNDGVDRIKQIVEKWKEDVEFYSIPVIFSAEMDKTNQWWMPPFYVNVRRDGIELWDQVAAELDEREAPLDFFEGEFRAMNKATLELIKQYWAESEYFWKDAMHSKEGGFLRGAVSRGFYAAFHALSAALYTVNVVRGKHKAIESAMHQYLIHAGLLEPEYGKMYSNLMRGRHIADYGSERKPGEPPEFQKLSEEEMNQMLDDGEKFLARMEKFLRERGALID